MTNLKATFEDTLRPGNVIAISMGHYSHWAIVSDRRCAKGKLMLISATRRNGTVREETYDTVVGGRKVGYARIQSALPVYQILTNARSQIGRWQYDALSRNCENFVNWACGLEPSSPQVTSGITGAVIGVVTATLIVENPKLMTFFFAVCAGAALGVASTQSPQQGS